MTELLGERGYERESAGVDYFVHIRIGSSRTDTREGYHESRNLDPTAKDLLPE